MDTEQTETVARVFCDIMERSAFLFAEAAEQGCLAAPQGTLLCACIRFAGPLHGEVGLTVPQALCPVIASNMLGTDAEDGLPSGNCEDALKELLNVICGHVLTTLAGPQAVFDLSVPAVRTLTSAQWAAEARSPNTLTFKAEEEPVLLKVAIEERAA